MPHEAVELLNAHLPLILVGITGAGKNAIMDYMVRNSGYRHIISHTTRLQRAYEKINPDYHFVSEDEMLRLIRDQAFIEVKVVHAKAVYGTSVAEYKKALLASGKPLLDMDVQGAKEVLNNEPQLYPVFILPPSFDIWMKRLSGRGPMTEAELTRRLQSAKNELSEVLNNKRFKLVINNEISAVAKEIVSDVTSTQLQRTNREVARQLLEAIIHQ
jgi:guanylate kinase